MFVVEIACPFLLFMGRRFRIVGAWSQIFLQCAIALTGNYCFFNLLTCVLALLWLDDLHLQKFGKLFNILHWLDQPRTPITSSILPTTGNFWLIRNSLQKGICLFLFALTFFPFFGSFTNLGSAPTFLAKAYEWVMPFRSINAYGLFAVMTTNRVEITVEGSSDLSHWEEYQFKYKPGDPTRHPSFVAPHQPRLDWQMWFAALGDYRQNSWFLRFCHGLLQGEPDVLALLAKNPFPGTPPKYIRAQRWEYHFSNWDEKRKSGVWWDRKEVGLYCPILKKEMFEPTP